MTPYEVRCHTCNVSFPPGTKRCLHCGGRTGVPALDLDTAGLRQMQIELGASPGAQEALPAELADEEAEVSRRTPLRVAMGAIWVLLAIVGSLYRVCTGGG